MRTHVPNPTYIHSASLPLTVPIPQSPPGDGAWFWVMCPLSLATLQIARLARCARVLGIVLSATERQRDDVIYVAAPQGCVHCAPGQFHPATEADKPEDAGSEEGQIYARPVCPGHRTLM